MSKVISGIVSNSRIVIVGAGGHGAVVADAIQASRGGSLLGFIDEDAAQPKTLGIAPVLGGNRDLPLLIEELEINAVVIAIGDNWLRRAVTEKIRKLIPLGVAFPPVVHPAATIGSKAVLGAGSVILAGAVVGVGTVLGEGCLVNTRASLDHHGRMGNFSSLAQAVSLGGDVAVGEGSNIAIGATVTHGRIVGDWSVVAAGSVVLDDIPRGVFSSGAPAVVRRTREPNEKYL